eukprot:271656-Amorphochlora_amoeboformis.AAC.1
MRQRNPQCSTDCRRTLRSQGRCNDKIAFSTANCTVPSARYGVSGRGCITGYEILGVRIVVCLAVLLSLAPSRALALSL